MKQIVEGLNLSSLLGTNQAKKMLAMAGYRGPQAEIAFLFFRLVMPILLFCITFVYIFFIIPLPYSVTIKVGAAVFAAYIGIKSPEIFLKNVIKKRQFSMRRAFPDSLDLLLICVESGMSIEHAFRRVSQEIGSQSVPLAEELTLTMAELSFLPDRRTASMRISASGLVSIRCARSSPCSFRRSATARRWVRLCVSCRRRVGIPASWKREERRRAAAKAHRAYDLILFACSVRRYHDARNYSDFRRHTLSSGREARKVAVAARSIERRGEAPRDPGGETKAHEHAVKRVGSSQKSGGYLLDPSDFGSSRSKVMNMIDSKSLELDVGEKPAPLFLIRFALACGRDG